MSTNFRGSRGHIDLASDVDVHLDAGSLLSLDGDIRGVEIRSLGGPLWVTQENDGDDHVVTSAVGLQIERLGRVVVQAIEDASIRISGAKNQSRGASTSRGDRGGRVAAGGFPKVA
jgi:hypothetical protein